MIAVGRSEAAAPPAQVDALLGALERDPGLWMGCDVSSAGLFERRSVACATPALRISLTGRLLEVTAMTAAGGALLPALRPLGEFESVRGGLRLRMDAGRAVTVLLRRFLALFQPRSAELALFGAFSFDYFRLAEDAPLPDDGNCRMVLYFPERVLVATDRAATWVAFSWAGGGEVGAVAPAAVANPQDEMPSGGHAKRVAKGVALLQRGELYSLVLSQTFRRRSAVPPAEAFAALRQRNPYPAMFFCNLGGGEILFGASPDLQVRADAQIVESAPVCGTLRRGADPAEDAAQALALLESQKEGAAIALCADSAADELSRVCEPGSVRVVSHRRPYFFSTIIHAISHVRGTRRPGLDAIDLLLAHAAPATVTGLPKPAAIRAIESLEADWRGWYAGAVARLGSDGSAEVYTVLRAARVAGGVAEIRTGGNIVADSDPDREEEESRLKALTLFRVLEGEGARPASPVTPAPMPIRILESDDAFAPRLANALALAGALPGPNATVSILSGTPRAPLSAGASVIAIGEGALWILAADGVAAERLPRPEIARLVCGTGLADGFLGARQLFAARYATAAIRPASLKAGWRAAAISEDGWLLAAQQDASGRCALFFRPDSVLSLQGDTGPGALAAALAWTTRDMVKT